tara:strand:+ start:11356 stop:12702 length:1347 start_codon:yes stop_codon:yes gene_type:complete
MIKLKENIILILIFPFLINFLFNLPSNNHIYYQSLLISFYCFIILYFIGRELDIVFELNSVSLSISFYLIGIFVINFFFLPLDQIALSFKEIFITYNIFITFIILLKSRKPKYFVFAIFLLIVFRYFSEIINLDTRNYIQYSSDVVEFWLPMSEMIYSNDLHFSIKNNLMPGYSLLINYIYAELFFLFIGETTLSFSLIIPNIFLYLSLLMFYEVKSSKKVKIYILTLYIAIILNSVWLSYLFFNSFMGEVIVNFLFSSFLINAATNSKISKSKLYFLFLGFLYFLKPFSSVLFIIIAITLFLKYKKYYQLYLPIIGFVINGIFSNFIFRNLNTQNVYLKIFSDNSEKLFDFYFQNIFLIFRQEIFIDKVITLFLILYLFVKLKSIKDKKNFNILNLILFLNLFLVLYLYSTIWKDIELGSAYRYIFSFINIYFIDLQVSINKTFKRI